MLTSNDEDWLSACIGGGVETFLWDSRQGPGGDIGVI